jgi:UDP-GlcNAc:undecaprenyl-phosphate/decaprenyl-phosphate GlcNAc-1-phosphate transferase
MDHCNYLILLVVMFGFMVTGAITPYFIKIARHYDIMAYPGGRKVHQSPTPLLGGAAIFIPYVLAFLFFYALIVSKTIVITQPSTLAMFSLFLGSIWIFFIGLTDDMYVLGWRKKLLGQLVGITILIAGGHSINTATVPFYGIVHFGWTGSILFGFIVLAITNAINIIDGLDGLAGGICFFAALTCGIIGYYKQDYFTATLAFTLSGALLGFLRHNFPPASIYMGDAGSLFLGFLLGTLATSSVALSPGQRSGTMGMLLVPFLPFGIALLDVFLAIVRRWIHGSPIFWADADHLHHRLMEKFQYPGRVVIILCSFSAFLSALTLCLTLVPYNTYLRVFMFGSFIVSGIVVVLLLRLYRSESLTTTWTNRPHFKYLCSFNSYMQQRINRVQNFYELLNLLDRGVKDLGFNSVEIYHNERLIEQWTNQWRIHLDKQSFCCERTFQDFNITVRWTVPTHDSNTYQKFLEITWFRFLSQIEERMKSLPENMYESKLRLIRSFTRHKVRQAQ